MIAVSKFYTGVQGYLQLKSEVVIQKLAIHIARKPPHKLKDWNEYSFHHKNITVLSWSISSTIFVHEGVPRYYNCYYLQKSTSSTSPQNSKSRLPTDGARSVDQWQPGVLLVLLPSWLLYKPSSEKGYKEKGWVRQLSKEISTPRK
jgi:hypothetical protein